MSVPEEHREAFRALVENRIKKYQEQIKKDRKALRLLDSEKTKPIYFVGIISCWQDEGEKNTFVEHEGTIRDAIKAGEKKYLSLNNRSNVDGHYHVGMQIGDVTEPLLAKFWSKFKKRG